MDEERYKNVIKACCLDIDIQNFGEVGDLLMIGDKGVNLSGGQKARISLARALYTDADLYLLDDPLAAVDPKVAKNIFDQCIGPQSLLRGKTRILVTHQTHFLVETDQMILMTNGQLEELQIEQRSAIEPSNDTSETKSFDDQETDWILNTAVTDMDPIVKNETSVDGAIKWSLFQWCIRQSAEAENFMTSAERIHEYGQLMPESHRNSNESGALVQPADDWPSRGIIEFKDYTFRYRPELDPVLKNLNLRIESKEKIGVIGRTGAGKSSLLQALFRLVDQSAINGIILIDGIDIGRLSLDHLRSHLSVIPQVPILFCGTLRYNIDPFEQFSDEECLTALEAVQLKRMVRNHPDGLHLLVAESGTNLSAGERQLVPLLLGKLGILNAKNGIWLRIVRRSE
ncbi:unnamed protein product [Rotaria sordida]|uniref:ABC transporter domain-containing protein n=1 Tax=Rotaria sordida TaxID=392033 RepID=A0A814YK71_9BILA|nr:unnamed protein product [Rotaria sordida]CAF1115797.1 unnamed protein product [Rotaria sordida]CAF1230181.1 unnamed protein product [Rotaria sordida]CAF1427570.1 unnamed protein product [Rotaria sordida]CAF3698972.1 unnamed protein product [Rotaria sordida]